MVAMLQPLDVIKTVQQGNRIGVHEALRVVLRTDGWSGLWTRGLLPTLIRGAIGPGVYFQAMQVTKDWGHGPMWDFGQGALARGAGALIVSPLSVLKTRSEWNPHTSLRFASLKDMYAGLLPTLARDVPFSGVYVLFFRRVKEHWKEKTFAADFSAGIVAGVSATLVTHPFDVVKTRSQLGLPLFAGWKNMWSGLSLRMTKRPLATALTWAIYEALARLWE